MINQSIKSINHQKHFIPTRLQH